MMGRIFSAVAVCALLVGCGQQAATQAVTTDVAAAEIALTAAERLAFIYTSLPHCLSAPSPVCSDPATVAKIKALDNRAYSAVVAARNNAALVGLAVVAITDLRNTIPGS